MNENQIAKQILDASFQIHTRTGPGLLESVYEIILAHELSRLGLHVERQRTIEIKYNDLVIPDAFRADIFVDAKVIVELKSVEALAPIHSKQLLTQLRLSGLKLGLLINFGATRLKDGIERIINGRLE